MVTWDEEKALTGRTRTRLHRRWFRPDLMVEQVEVAADRFETNPVDVDIRPVLLWRDRKPCDVLPGAAMA